MDKKTSNVLFLCNGNSARSIPMSAHWGVEDPAQAGGSEEHRRKACSDALMLMSRRIAIFANLPLEKLNKLALQSELDRIGRER